MSNLVRSIVILIFAAVSVSPLNAASFQIVSLPQQTLPARSESAEGSLKSLLKATQAAAQAGHREEFDLLRARLRSTLATYPPGPERTAASEVARIYDDLGRLWTYEFDSRAGSFFETSSEQGRMMRAYPD